MLIFYSLLCTSNAEGFKIHTNKLVEIPFWIYGEYSITNREQCHRAPPSNTKKNVKLELHSEQVHLMGVQKIFARVKFYFVPSNSTRNTNSVWRGDLCILLLHPDFAVSSQAVKRIIANQSLWNMRFEFE